MPDGAFAIGQVEVRDVGKVYEGKRALLAVSHTFCAGQITALLGENGAGKSTLLGVLGLQIRPTQGTLFFNGQAAASLNGEWLRGQLSLLSHKTRLYADLTARENLLFFSQLYLSDKTASERENRATQWLRQVGLTHAADRTCRTFSRGMSQRLAIARALLHEPNVLLLDEPFSGLDQEGVELLRSLIVQQRARGSLIVVVSHDFEPLAQGLDQALVLRKGRVEKTASFEPGQCSRERLLSLYRGSNET